MDDDEKTLARIRRAAVEAELRDYRRALRDKLDAERRMRTAARELAALGERLPEDG